jgi:hypothetical protein
MGDMLSVASDVGDRYGASVGHRLEQGQRSGLAEAGQTEDIASLKDIADISADPPKLDRVSDP